jgi:outer membrane protein TolC
MSKRFLFLLVIIACTGVAVFAQHPLMLSEAIDTALARNRDLVKLALSLQSELLSRDRAAADFAITVRPGGSADRGDRRASYNYGVEALRKFTWGTGLTLGGKVEDLGIDDSDVSKRDSLRVEVSQPLFRYAGPLVNLDNLVSAGSQIAAARRNIELKKTDLVLQVVQSYVEILRLGRQLNSDRKSLERSEGLLKLTRAREAQGRVSRVDTLRVDLQRGQAESRVEIAQEQLISTQLDFAELLGAEPGATYALEPLPDLAMSPPSVETATRIALSNRLDYAQVLWDYRDAERGVRVSRHYLLPDVRLVTRYEQFGEGSTASDASDLSEDSWFVGARAATDLPMRKEQISYKQSLVSEQSAREAVDISEIFIQKQVQQQLLAFDRAKSEAIIAGRNLAAADSRVKLSRRLFELGRSDNFSVTDAEDAYRKAENDFLAAKAEASVAAYRLRRVLGSLIEYPEDLKPKPI